MPLPSVLLNPGVDTTPVDLVMKNPLVIYLVQIGHNYNPEIPRIGIPDRIHDLQCFGGWNLEYASPHGYGHAPDIHGHVPATGIF